MTALDHVDPSPAEPTGFDPAHRHTARCYWDHHRCAWSCTERPGTGATPRR